MCPRPGPELSPAAAPGSGGPSAEPCPREEHGARGRPSSLLQPRVLPVVRPQGLGPRNLERRVRRPWRPTGGRQAPGCGVPALTRADGFPTRRAQVGRVWSFSRGLRRPGCGGDSGREVAAGGRRGSREEEARRDEAPCARAPGQTPGGRRRPRADATRTQRRAGRSRVARQPGSRLLPTVAQQPPEGEAARPFCPGPRPRL